jgi:hypothetical protein
LVFCARVNANDTGIFLGRLRVAGRRVVNEHGIRPYAPHG